MDSLDEIIINLCKINNEEIMKKLLTELFTPSEIKDITLRWQLLKMLAEGISQREIASTLGISLCKITRGSKILKDENSILNIILCKNNETIK